MSDQTQPQKPDLAQRIAEALSRTDEPRPPVCNLKFLERVSSLGEVPFHLRHLSNLVDDLRDEAEGARAKVDMDMNQLFEFIVDEGSVETATEKLQALLLTADLAEDEVDTADALLFISLERHIPTHASHAYVAIQSNWSVIGFSEDDVIDVDMTQWTQIDT